MSDFVSSTYKRDSETRFGMTKLRQLFNHLAIEILKQVQNDKNFILKKFHVQKIFSNPKKQKILTAIRVRIKKISI